MLRNSCWLLAARCWRERLRAFSLVPCALSLFLIAGCRQDMHNQPKYRGLRPSAFFADGSSARPLVEGTVARGTLQEDEAFFTGKIDKATVKEFPIPVDDALVDRGQERYNIYCSPCHDRTGGGSLLMLAVFGRARGHQNQEGQGADESHVHSLQPNG